MLVSKTVIPIAILAGVAVSSCALTSFWGLTSPVFKLSDTQILYLFSTSAQVLAGVYGLTLTGFIFFRNELSREEFEDETLSEAVESLKKHYFALLAFITVLVLLTFALANIAISGGFGSSSSLIILNAGQSLFATSIISIAYFIFDVTSPKNITKASRALQSKIDPELRAQTHGSLQEFIKNYNRIEKLLNDYVLANLYDNANSRGHTTPYRRTSNLRLAEILFHNEKIPQELF